MTTGSGSKVAVLICATDARMDVLERVLPSIRKFWPDCPYPIYIGLNTNHSFGKSVSTLIARPTQWRQECLEHIEQISASHVIVLLDDFLIQKPVDQARLATLVNKALESNLPYLRLVPLGKSLFARVTGFARRSSDPDILPIVGARPYYSGLQVSIWNTAHFRSMLQLPGSIWEFEHQRISGVTHYVIAANPPIHYSHLVEKGRWLPTAKSLLRRAGLPDDLGARSVWPQSIKFQLAVNKACLLLFGFPIN